MSDQPQPEAQASDQAKAESKEEAAPANPTISFDDFIKVQLRVGKVIEAGEHPNADKLLVLKVDLGDEQRQICAGLKGYYTPDELLGKNVVVVANLAPRMMRGLESQGMLLAASDADKEKVIVVGPHADIAPGSGVS
ncbi:MAG: methionine--tRNA ligase subunit beta [Phycisphaerae bacterium]